MKETGGGRGPPDLSAQDLRKDAARKNYLAHLIGGVYPCHKLCPTSLQQPKCALYHGTRVGMDVVIAHLLGGFMICK